MLLRSSSCTLLALQHILKTPRTNQPMGSSCLASDTTYHTRYLRLLLHPYPPVSDITTVLHDTVVACYNRFGPVKKSVVRVSLSACSLNTSCLRPLPIALLLANTRIGVPLDHSIRGGARDCCWLTLVAGKLVKLKQVCSKLSSPWPTLNPQSKCIPRSSSSYYYRELYISPNESPPLVFWQSRSRRIS